MTASLVARTRGRAGPVVVLLHGLGASGRLWHPVVRYLPADLRLVCPDLLGFGRSPRPSVAYSLADHLTALDALLDRVIPGDEPVVLGGTSLGAVLALEWAAARPGRFLGVALIALPAYRTNAEARACVAALSPLAWATVHRPDVGEIICGIMCAGRPLWRALMPLLTPSTPADIARDFVLHDWASYYGTLCNVLLNHRVHPTATRLAEAGAPVRLLHGDGDRTAPVDAARALAVDCGWPLTVLAAGHRLPLEAPAACAAMLHALVQSASPFQHLRQ